MLPNSRMIPPSSQENRPRSLSSTAVPSLYLSSEWSSSRSSKTFLSRFRATPPSVQQQRSVTDRSLSPPITRTTRSQSSSTPRSSQGSEYLVTSQGDLPHISHQHENPMALKRHDSNSTPTHMKTIASHHSYVESPGSFMDYPAQHGAWKKTPSRGSMKSFGKLFKKLSKSSDEDTVDDQPQIRPISASNRSSGIRASHNIPLAPPPPPSATTHPSFLPQRPEPSISPDQLLTGIPEELLAKPAFHRPHLPKHRQDEDHPYKSRHASFVLPSTQGDGAGSSHCIANAKRSQSVLLSKGTDPSKSISALPHRTTDPAYVDQPRPRMEEEQNSSRISNDGSTRKSSGSYSIYSTFGSDSHHSSENALDVRIHDDDTIHHAQPWKLMRSRHDLHGHTADQMTSKDRLSQHIVSSVNELHLGGIHPPISDLHETESVDSFNTVASTMDSAIDRGDEDNDDDCDDARSMLLKATIPYENSSTYHDSKDGNTSTDTETYNDQHTVDSDDDDEEEDDTDGAVFVDATGLSQEDIEREKGEAKLSKRLSGGHFGSAGGLVLSIAPPLPSTKSPHRRSQPPPEDLAQAMLNWKRHSGGATKKHSKDFSTVKFDKQTMAGSIIGLKEEDAEENERSPDDVRNFREQAAQALSGPPANTENLRRGHKPSESLTSFTDSISKALDAAWNAPTIEDIHVQDPRHLEDVSTRDHLNVEHAEVYQEAKDAAHRLWMEDETFITTDKIAEWLGQGKTFNSEALVWYIKNFYFANMRLDSAFRKLCSKLYFRAEAQQIDRILEAFANRYWDCNPQSLFGSADVVYAVIYSLLLLNTDLHVAQGNHNRMTRQEFIRNTMMAIHDQQQSPKDGSEPLWQFSKAWEMEMEAHLKELYTSVKQYQILQPLARRPSTNGQHLEKRGSILGGRRVIGLKRSVNSIIRKSARESMLISEENQPRKSTSSGHSRPSSPQTRPCRRESISSLTSGSSSFYSRSTNLSSPQPFNNFSNSLGSDSFTNRSPYHKEGIIMRKHLLETADHKAKHREWRECFLVVGHGELKMYALHHPNEVHDRKSIFRPTSATYSDTGHRFSQHWPSFADVHESDPQWMQYTQLIGTIELKHTLANVLPPPGYNRQRPHVFAIQQPHGGVYLFQASSIESANEWVFTCNYWSARESKEPLPGGVSNMEYGWGRCLNDVILDLDAMDNGTIQGNCIGDPDAVIIYEWKPPVPPMVSSTMDEKEQYAAFQKHLQALNEEINDHRELKSKILVKFPSKCDNHTKVLSNWEAKSRYLLHDIIKYQNYCDVLEKSMERRHQLEEKRQRQEKKQEKEQLTFVGTPVDLVKEIADELQLAF
ncbi:uncharacterized protein BYT42DRAFT_554203 [Radiomyces spectabilis]|uniref:uncharacterized protein n=1 Tax=Radiomyces spectabilis TaxID=64574 RepID=UPI00221FD137|nr:uncharacterized protein BYT42DRAFT_554203 [Radiomyces spectabilis]KAI8394319.1 hypothetical protein BYT42DRAFT_554203 [Radiomyces spectabilis]